MLLAIESRLRDPKSTISKRALQPHHGPAGVVQGEAYAFAARCRDRRRGPVPGGSPRLSRRHLPTVGTLRGGHGCCCGAPCTPVNDPAMAGLPAVSEQHCGTCGSLRDRPKPARRRLRAEARTCTKKAALAASDRRRAGGVAFLYRRGDGRAEPVSELLPTTLCLSETMTFRCLPVFA